jgi:hypothetical protein
VGESESVGVGVSVVERVYARRMYSMFFGGDEAERRPNPGLGRSRGKATGQDKVNKELEGRAHRGRASTITKEDARNEANSSRARSFRPGQRQAWMHGHGK